MGIKSKLVEELAQRVKGGDSLAVDYASRMGAGTAVGAGLMGSEEAEAGVITKGGKKVIDAWHGSPHDFDKFQMSQIGTGEGAQAYGHGLYFADAKETAKSYRDMLTDEILVDGKPISNMTNDYSEMTLLNANFDIDRAISDAQGHLNDLDLSAPVGKIKEKGINTGLEKLKGIKERGSIKTQKGSLFNVNIDATPDELLDWDLPIRESGAFDKVKQAQGGDYSGYSTGQDYYNLHGSPQEASKTLQEQGIKGIQYNDAMSRGAGGGTKNYVIFDENIISIANKYGLPVATATLVAQGVMTPQEAMASSRSSLPTSNISSLISQPTNLRINDTISPNEPISGGIANLIEQADRATMGSPANLLVPTGLSAFMRNVSTGKDNTAFDYGMAAADLLP